MGSRIQEAVYRGQWLAATVIPIGWIGMTMVAGGGLLFGGFVLLAIPFGVLLAVPPTVGHLIGRMRTSVDVTMAYVLCSVALWAGCLAFGIALGIGTEENDYHSFRWFTPWIAAFIAGAWIALVTAGVLARRHTNSRSLVERSA